MKSEERQAFAARLGIPVEQIELFDMLNQHIDYDNVVEGADAILVGGSGAFSVRDDIEWMHQFIKVLGEIADHGFPMFASCFGFQALVMALGGLVDEDDAGAEVGSYEIDVHANARADTLFQTLPKRFVAQQGHKDRVLRLPSAVTNFASSVRCPYQAIRVPGKPVYATQFHPELTAADNRLRFQRYFDMYAKAFGASRATRMLEEFEESPEANSLLPSFHALLGSGAFDS